MNPSIVIGVAELPDGRLVAPGTGPHFETSAVFMFKPDGSLDTSFGNGGLAEMDFEPGGAESFHALAVQPDGKIVAVGGTSTDPDHQQVYHNRGGMEQFSIARFKADGSPDRRFTKKGGRQLDLTPGPGGCEFTSVELLSDGRILAAGFGDPGIDGTRDIYLARFQNKEALDGSFDDDGWINLDIMGDEIGVSLIVLTDHFYVVGASGLHPVFGWTPFLAHVWEE